MESVLIIDDHAGNLGVAVGYLEGHAIEVLTARDGESGLRRARLARPSLILLDIEMPGLDGYEVCRRLKSHPETREIPIIFMSVRESPEDKVRGFELSAVDYVSKPFHAAELVARVRTHLEHRSLRRELEERVASGTAALEQELRQREQSLREREALLELLERQREHLRALEARPGSPPPPTAGSGVSLSARELEVLHLLADGRSNKEIAASLNLAPSSVSTYRLRLMDKLGVADIAALLREAAALGLDRRGG